MTAAWATFLPLVGLLLALELLVFTRRPRPTTPNASVAWTAFYVLLAAMLNVGIYLMYEHNWLGAAGDSGQPHAERHEKASVQFLSCYLLETALSLDSVFAISAIFTHFRVPQHYRRRVLMAGLIPAIIVRGGLIVGGAALVTTVHWFVFVLSALLLLAILRMILVRRENMDPDRNWIYKVLRRFFPGEKRESGDLVTVTNGWPALTPLLTVLVLIETADGLYAFDSLPGVFAYSQDPFIIFAAHVMALFTFRAMYFALEPLLGWIRYIKIGLAFLLAYSAVAVAMPKERVPEPEVSLAFLSGTVLVGLLTAAIFGHSGPAPQVSPLGEDAERLARVTLKQSRRVIALLVGSAVVLLGLVMIPGPGPGLLVIPIGLAILGAEFLWARRLLDKYKSYAMKAGLQASERLTRTPRPWLIPIVYGVTIIAMILLVQYTRLRPAAVIGGSIPLLIGQTVWAVITVRRYRAQRRAAAEQGEPK